MIDIINYTLEELENILKNWQAPDYSARQIFSWLYKKCAASFDQMTDLPSELRQRLKENFSIGGLTLVREQASRDGARKFLFFLKDGNIIESVLIPAPGRNSACLSTQVGCKYACSFCASGMKGFKRNLETGEIISQALEINRRLKDEKISHIVFMGVGEPLDNYQNVLKAIRIINFNDGLNIGARRITVSTAGIIPGIERLAKEGLQIELSVSLHSADDNVRSALLPINKKYPLFELISCCRKYALATKRQVTFEYILIKGLNCSSPAADKLIKLLRGWESKVNLIIYNPVEESAYQPPGKLEVLFFRQRIKDAGIPVTIRKSRGCDIQGACGQLRAVAEFKDDLR